MRLFTVLCSILLLSAVAWGQAPARGIAGYCPYGCGPYLPLVTTPMISLDTVSTAPAGASNATGGLVAGATNSTLSQSYASPNSVYTQPVWYAGGTTPKLGPAVRIGLPIARTVHVEREVEVMKREGERPAWRYFAPSETASATEAMASARGAKKATRTYTNQDVERQNQKNGEFKYDGKAGKIQ
ncbi:MAG TPA: hypothetical protein VJX16_13005 [Terriglobales bacterium]|nr:hypothetical protein [Terriglobales bacterium]